MLLAKNRPYNNLSHAMAGTVDGRTWTFDVLLAKLESLNARGWGGQKDVDLTNNG